MYLLHVIRAAPPNEALRVFLLFNVALDTLYSLLHVLKSSLTSFNKQSQTQLCW